MPELATTEEQRRRLQASFRVVNRLMLLNWRLGLGRFMATARGGYIMVLATTGNRTGERRLAPVNFAEEGSAVTCTAGFGAGTAWLRNLRAEPRCEVWLPWGRASGVAEEVDDPADRLAVIRAVLARSGFAAKAFEGIDIHTIDDEALAERTERFVAVRIRLGAPVHGPGGPGDLWWVWPALGGAWLARRRWRRHRRLRARRLAVA